ncbi:MAG: alpha-glucosidase [Novosphingobium sp.]|uniref:alpha-glucosidase n=1 Tax=Novosphingobium sp. TaxID=1874826 RepID=UPI003C7CF07D
MNRLSRIEIAQTQAGAQPWWRGAAIYQVYPRSYHDSNGDGVGDLPGVTARLDHIASLGADAIWISPFFTSPMADFGYDVADYCDVDPIFGTLADFDALIERAHQLGLKVMVDQVYSHTSDEHAWFAQSRASRSGDKADWYVWADAKADGSPPSNWQSVFGGPAWTWDARRGQYYMHNFLAAQPQLNCHLPAVQDALLDVARFWLDRGVDGFRLDALNFAMHDPALTDNPAAPDDGQPRTRPFDFQLHVHNQSHADIPRFLERIRALCDTYGAVFTMAEVGGREALREMQTFTAGNQRLNSAYGFDFLYADKLTPALVSRAQANWAQEPEAGWPSWAFENHDAPRALSRWCTPDQRELFARTKIAVLCALRGSIIIYQGEELGLVQVDIPFDQLKDPEAIANWPLTLSRDGARTPMPWTAQDEHGGFSAGQPWLPLGSQNLAQAADRQNADPHSLLNLTRELLALRASHPALRSGDLAVAYQDHAVLALRRTDGEQSVLAIFNLDASAQSWPVQLGATGQTLISINGAIAGQGLPPFATLYLEETR